MPELPDIVVYIEALEPRILGETLQRIKITAPFLLRTAEPPITSVEGRKVVELRRLGKRICIGLEEELWLVLHLMIAGRLHWHERRVGAGLLSARSDRAAVSNAPGRGTHAGSPRGGIGSGRVPKNQLAAFDFSNGTLSLTEAGTQRRASLHLLQGEAELQHLDPGGLEIFDTDLESFAQVLRSANHTLKRALTDPRLFSGIGNAYSDEILWDAQLSPIALTQKLTSEEIERLFTSTRATLSKWIEILRTDKIRTGSGPGSTAEQPGWGGGSDGVEPEQKAPQGRRSARSLKTGGGRDQVFASSNVKHQKSNVQDGISQGEEGRLAPAPLGAIGGFPEKVTAFRPGMAVHGKYQQLCPRCGEKIQRIRYASNETNYCPSCQTAGKLLADRALSRLLRADWPRTADELEGLSSR